MHVETSFVRNLGGLMPPAAATRGPGPVGEAPWSEARPEGMRYHSELSGWQTKLAIEFCSEAVLLALKIDVRVIRTRAQKNDRR